MSHGVFSAGQKSLGGAPRGRRRCGASGASIPVIVVNGAKSGPVLALVAGSVSTRLPPQVRAGIDAVPSIPVVVVK